MKREWGFLWFPAEPTALELGVALPMPSDIDFHPMALWVWGGPDCQVKLSVRSRTLVEWTPVARFGAPLELDAMVKLLERDPAAFQSSSLLTLPPEVGSRLFVESRHPFPGACEPIRAGDYAELEVAGVGFSGAALLGRWFI